MSSYNALAGSYDQLMLDVQHVKRADWLERAFRKSAIPVKSVLDLGCGTGTIACLLAERGYDVIATDLSEKMLTQAACKAADLEERAPVFLCQTMPRLRLVEQVDAVISTVDAVNYLTRETDIRETFRRVFRWLKDGGAFIFDVNTPYKLRRMDGQMYMDETEESFCVWRTFFSEKRQICTYQVDLFTLNEDGAWDREFEEHRERAWSEEQLRLYLAEAGFVNIRFSGDLTSRKPRPDEDRWIIRAEKPNKT